MQLKWHFPGTRAHGTRAQRVATRHSLQLFFAAPLCQFIAFISSYSKKHPSSVSNNHVCNIVAHRLSINHCKAGCRFGAVMHASLEQLAFTCRTHAVARSL